MKTYLKETFQFNDHANKMVLEKIKLLPDQQQCIRFFSHIINSQNKWISRINMYPNDPKVDWWLPLYRLEELEPEWDKSLQQWLDLIDSKTEEELDADVRFVGYDGSVFAAPLKDIALQLNYHSIHHRAQIQIIIRQQGFLPDFIDYIGTKYRRVDG